jgi:disulfide bond formation protein DsbB
MSILTVVNTCFVILIVSLKVEPLDELGFVFNGENHCEEKTVNHDVVSKAHFECIASVYFLIFFLGRLFCFSIIAAATSVFTKTAASYQLKDHFC